MNHSPVHASTSRDDTWLLLENMLSSASHPSHSMIFESNIPYVNSNKAIFTILLPSSEVNDLTMLNLKARIIILLNFFLQILVVNSATCKLLNFSSEELCSMKLENLVHDRHKHKIAGLKDPSLAIFSSGKLVCNFFFS